MLTSIDDPVEGGLTLDFEDSKGADALGLGYLPSTALTVADKSGALLNMVDSLSEERHKKYVFLESNYLSFVEELRDLLDPSTGLVRAAPSPTDNRVKLLKREKQEIERKRKVRSMTGFPHVDFPLAIGDDQVAAIDTVFRVIEDREDGQIEIRDAIAVLKRSAQFTETKQKILVFVDEGGYLNETTFGRVVESIDRNCDGICNRMELLAFFSSSLKVRKLAFKRFSFTADRKKKPFDPLTCRTLSNPKEKADLSSKEKEIFFNLAAPKSKYTQLLHENKHYSKQSTIPSDSLVGPWMHKVPAGSSRLVRPEEDVLAVDFDDGRFHPTVPPLGKTVTHKSKSDRRVRFSFGRKHISDSKMAKKRVSEDEQKVSIWENINWNKDAGASDNKVHYDDYESDESSVISSEEDTSSDFEDLTQKEKRNLLENNRKLSPPKQFDSSPRLEEERRPSRDYQSDETGTYMYKQCGLVIEPSGSSRIVSIYDGKTAYNMNEWKIQNDITFGGDLDGHGFYVYATKDDALHAIFPKGSKAKDLPRVLLKVFVPNGFNVKAVRSLKQVASSERKVYVCSRLKPVHMWDICPNRHGESGKALSWQIIEWSHSGAWRPTLRECDSFSLKQKRSLLDDDRKLCRDNLEDYPGQVRGDKYIKNDQSSVI
jgi:hypothetical protein